MDIGTQRRIILVEPEPVEDLDPVEQSEPEHEPDLVPAGTSG